ncbi:MAG: hypothetical protein ABIQ33_10810 [Caldimonas sp.]
MIRGPEDLLWLVAAIVVLFAAVIVFGLKVRARKMSAFASMPASEAWAPFASGPWKFADLLYGGWQDRSMLCISLRVKDCRGREVGRIDFRTGAGGIAIICEGQPFHAVRDRKRRTRWELWPSPAGAEAHCSVERIGRGRHRFEVRGADPVDACFAPWWKRPKSCVYEAGGRQIGACQRLSDSFDKGVSLAVPSHCFKSGEQRWTRSSKRR